MQEPKSGIIHTKVNASFTSRIQYTRSGDFCQCFPEIFQTIQRADVQALSPVLLMGRLVTEYSARQSSLMRSLKMLFSMR